jgi:phosphotransferase system enzyme I (PtsI)
MQLKGLGVSPGIGVGRALVVTRGRQHLRFRIPERRLDAELARLDAARVSAREQIARIKQRITDAAGTEHAYIFEAQRLMLDDPMLVDRAAAIVRSERLNAESALERALDEISALFDRIDDPYLRERKGDVADVVGRLCMNLRSGGDPIELFRDADGPLVLVAEELSPSLIAQLDFHRLAGFVTDAGSWTYHTAILARSIHLPAVSGVRHAAGVIAPGVLLAVDGSAGQVWIDPPPEQLAELEARSRKRRAYERSLEDYVALPAVTLDGTPIRIEANVELPEEAARARRRGAEGIGLYRSEFLLAGTTAASLDEEVQYLVYCQLIDAMGGGRVTVRTFDVTETQMGLVQGGEPARSPLGLRGLRLSLSFEEFFQAQLRALLRAAAHGPLRIMFP